MSVNNFGLKKITQRQYRKQCELKLQKLRYSSLFDGMKNQPTLLPKGMVLRYFQALIIYKNTQIFWIADSVVKISMIENV